jgi:hypothetical protein
MTLRAGTGPAALECACLRGAESSIEDGRRLVWYKYPKPFKLLVDNLNLKSVF